MTDISDIIVSVLFSKVYQYVGQIY